MASGSGSSRCIAGQRSAAEGQLVTGAGVPQQLLALHHIQVEIGEVRGKYPDQSCLTIGGQLVVQPQSLLAAGQIELVGFLGEEAFLQRRAADLVELQAGIGIQ